MRIILLFPIGRYTITISDCCSTTIIIIINVMLVKLLDNNNTRPLNKMLIPPCPLIRFGLAYVLDHTCAANVVLRWRARQ